MKLNEVQSSAFSHVGYDEKTHDLHVRFSGDSDCHVFHHVSPEAHAAFLNAKSLGKYFAKHIRNRHKFTRPK